MSNASHPLPPEHSTSRLTPRSRLRAVAPSQTVRRSDIQGLRAVAVLMVVAFHAGLPVRGGFLGVDVFFAISGFVITSVLVGELESAGKLDLPAFYARRVKRLLPALALMLVVVLSLSPLLAPIAAGRATALTGAAASLFAANGYLMTLGTGYFDTDTTLNPLLHTWTLAVEEQFYLVFPLALLMGWQLRRGRLGAAMGRGGAAIAVTGLSLVSFAVSLGLSGVHSSNVFNTLERVAFYGSMTRAWEFGAGALVALAGAPARRLDPGRTWLLQLAGLTGIVAAALVHDRTAAPGMVAVLPVVGTCALLFAGAGPATKATRLLGTRPAVWIGDLSYSWYLWHWPLIVFATSLWPGGLQVGTGAAVASLLPAWLSYRFVENPIRFRRWPSRRSVVGLALVCIVASLAVAGGSLAARSALTRTSAMKSWARSQEWHLGEARGCNSPTPLSDRPIGICSWAAPHARGTVVLVGDSNAGHFAEPVVSAARRTGLTTIIATFPSCPFTEARIVGTRAREAPCHRFDSGTLTGLLRLKPNLVIVAARTDKYVEDPRVGIRRPDGSTAKAAAEKARLWTLFLRNALARLNAGDVPVLVVRPVPLLPPSTERCNMVRVLTDTCAVSISRDEVDRMLGRSIDAEDRAVRRLPATWALSVEDQLCGKRRCASQRAGLTLYRNYDHLSVDGARFLTGRFYEAIRAHART